MTQHIKSGIRLLEMKYLKSGDRIHLYSRNGIYRVVKTKKNEIDITCNVWEYEENPIRTIRYDDFKCLAGGIWKKGG